MNIGIFGDSYADTNAGPDSWWRFLEKEHGHTVTSYGLAASSIFYSVNLLLKNHNQFDFNIWCLTCPGRFSIFMPEHKIWFHSAVYMNLRGQQINSWDWRDDVRLRTACQDYLKYIFDNDAENIVGKALVLYLQTLVPNLLVIPCFPPPLEMAFNLYHLCEKELKVFFPDQEVHEIYRSYQDIRACHLSRQNNRILAGLINADLKPGIFQTNYEEFDFQNLKLSDVLRPLPKS